MQTKTKLKKRENILVNKELKALNSMRINDDLIDAINCYIIAPHLTAQQQARLRACLAVLSHAPLTQKLLASL